MSKTRLRATDYNTEPSPGRVTRITKWWFAPEGVTRKSKQVWGTFLGALAATLATLLIISWFQTPDPQTVPVSAAPAPVQVEKSACPEQEAVQVPPEILISTQLSTVWVRDGDMQRPTSETAGPAKDKPFPQCYSRTPEGALYAAAGFASGILTATAAGDQKPFFQERASHTGNYTVLIADLPDAGPVQNRPTVRFSGYRWNSYTPELASVEIRYTLLTGPRAGSTTALTYTMTWERNDWLLVVPGKTDTVAVSPDSNHTYIPWGGTA